MMVGGRMANSMARVSLSMLMGLRDKESGRMELTLDLINFFN
jgi:hypothetical protein